MRGAERCKVKSVRRAPQGAPLAVTLPAAGAPVAAAARAEEPAITGCALAALAHSDGDRAARDDDAGDLITEIVVGLADLAADDTRRITIARIARAGLGQDRYAPKPIIGVRSRPLARRNRRRGRDGCQQGRNRECRYQPAEFPHLSAPGFG